MPPIGKYFYIRCGLNGLVLDIEDMCNEPGGKIITWEKKDDEPDNQLWYEEHSTGTIRSKMNDLCFTAGGDGLTMEEYEEDNDDQQWRFKHGQSKIRNGADRNRVLDIMDNNEDAGARVGAWDDNDGPNQQFDSERVNTRYFMIRSRMNELVLDIDAQSRDEGAKVIMWEETGDDNQLWYEDEDGIIKSKMHDFAMEANHGDKARMCPCDSSRGDHQWHRVGQFIAQRSGRGHVVLDIEAQNQDPGAELIAWDKTGEDNQRWRFEYT